MSQPAFNSPESCRQWLASTPLGTSAQAQATLLTQINLLGKIAIPAPDRMAILELLREPILLAQEDCTRRFAGKPLPLTAQEQSYFDTTINLWQAQVAGYSRCLEPLLAGQKIAEFRPQLAAQRGLAALAAAQMDHYRGCRRPDTTHWQALNGIFSVAEYLRLSEEVVEDPMRPEGTSVRSTYVEALLINAADPFRLPQRLLVWTERWARKWARKVKILTLAPQETGRSRPLCVNLLSAAPASFRPGTGDGVRWLDTAELRLTIKRCLLSLNAGEAPAALDLGDDCTQPAGGEHLMQLYQRWCKGGARRRFERGPIQGACPMIYGFDAIHYYISGRKPFEQPATLSADKVMQEREQIAIFGRAVKKENPNFSREMGYQIEQWNLHDTSANGIRVSRPAGQGGARVGSSQLVALSPERDGKYLLGAVRWVVWEPDGTLEAGAVIFPGAPETIAFRPAGPRSAAEKFRQALLLPPVAALKEETTLILPFGTYRNSRVLDLSMGDAVQQVRLVQLVERASDFERCSFTLL